MYALYACIMLFIVPIQVFGAGVRSVSIKLAMRYVHGLMVTD